MTRTISTFVVLFLVALLPARPGVALDPDVKCQANKKKAAGKYALCRMKALSKADRRGQSPDFTRCESKFSTKWTIIESKAGGACPTAGDEIAIKALVDACVGNWGDALPLPKKVFITSQSYMPGAAGAGRFNSLATADAHCQALAEAATPPLATTGYPVFKAWMSDSAEWPADGARFTQPAAPYRLVDGSVVANDWADLIDGNIALPIDIDENGNAQCCSVWTATDTNGTSLSNGTDSSGCTNWTTANPFPAGAAEGFANMTNFGWTAATPLTCDQTGHFYCFEQ